MLLNPALFVYLILTLWEKVLQQAEQIAWNDTATSKQSFRPLY